MVNYVVTRYTRSGRLANSFNTGLKKSALEKAKKWKNLFSDNIILVEKVSMGAVKNILKL